MIEYYAVVSLSWKDVGLPLGDSPADKIVLLFVFFRRI